MLAPRAKEPCRVCGRELCGNQRRWLFHTASRLNLQVLLSHVLGREVARDGRPEFACSKCAFMLERVYRFDAVIARVEALSIERLQRLLLEKERLKLCVASLYRRNNGQEEEEEEEAAGGGGTVDMSALPDARYTALLQEDFVYSGFECWTAQEESGPEAQHCHAAESAGQHRSRRCRTCAALRVADADYEAICKVPRKIARGTSCGPSTTCSASLFNEELPGPRVVTEGESLEKLSSGSSVESLHAAGDTGPVLQKEDEVRKGSGDCCADNHTLVHGNRIDLALSLVKTLDYRPVHSPRGSRIPVKLIPPALKSSTTITDANTHSCTLSSAFSFLNKTLETNPKVAQDLSPEFTDLQELWEEICEDYMPLCTQNLTETQHHRRNQYETAADQYITELQTAELHVQTLQNKIMENQVASKILQEKLQTMDLELRSVRGTSEKQERTIQSLNEALKNKENEIEELYHVMGQQDKTTAQLREMLHTTKAQHLQIPEDSSPFKQQAELLDMQDTLIGTQLELQKGERALRQKEYQLSNAKRVQQLLEVDIQEAQLQKETTWKHNQELHAALHDLQCELQDKKHQMQSLEQVKSSEVMALENSIQRLKEMLCQKEQLLQDQAAHLQDKQNLEKHPEMSDTILNKLRLRIKDRDLALERAVDDKFCALEGKEKELRHLQLTMREKDHELEKLRGILTNNEETIKSLDSLLKLKDQELDQVSKGYRHLQWLGQQVQEKYSSSLKERERIILNLHSSQQEQSKEHQELMATLLTKTNLGNTAILEELHLCLKRKEKMLQDSIRDRHQQAAEYEQEIQELLKSMTSRMVVQDFLTDCSQATGSIKDIGTTNLETLALEKELANASDELQLMSRKERETRLELLALQCTVGKQNEELQAREADFESLTKKIHIKEELIKDLQMQLVNPEEMPHMGRLVQEVLELREKLSTVESHAQECPQSRGQELLLNLEQLVTEKAKLNEALKDEKHLYSNLVASLMQPVSFERDTALQVELEAVQGLRGRLEEALDKSLKHLSRLEADSRASSNLGDPSTGDKGADRGSKFTDSTEDDTADGKSESTCSQKNNIGSSKTMHVSREATLILSENSLNKGGSPKEEPLQVKCESPQLKEEKGETDGESKAKREEAGSPSVYPSRVMPPSLCWDEIMKDQMQQAKSIWWESETQKMMGHKKEDGEMDDKGQRSEIRKLHEKMSNADPILNLSQEEMLQNCQEGAGKMNPGLVLGMSKDLEGLKTETVAVPVKRSALGVQLREEAAKRHCTRPQSLDLGTLLCQSTGNESKLPSSANQVDFDSESTCLGQDVKLSLKEQTERLCSELIHCKQQNRELQGKLVVSEATVHAQGDQLKQFQLLLSEPLVTQDSKEVQVGLQDLGYETCGRSENEADREEASSPECNDKEDFLTEAKTIEKMNSRYKFCGSAATPTKCKLGSHKELIEWDISVDVPSLHQHIKELRRQLYRSEQLIHKLQSHVPAGDLRTGMDELQGMKGSVTIKDSPAHSVTDEDEGWHSDSLGPLSSSEKDLQKLIKRVSLLETQLQKPRQDGMPPDQLRSSTWPGRYDTLIQAQARELSHLRQKLREGRGVCHILTQHLGDTIKSFEELLRANDIDYYMGKSFREQLTKGNHLAERLAGKLNRREHSDVDDKSGHELLALRLSKELQQKDKIIEDLQAKLQEPSMTPSSSRAISESDQSDRTSFVSDDQVSTNDDLDVCSDVDTGSEYTRYEQESIRNSTHSASDLISSSAAFPSKPSPAIISHELQTQSNSHTSLPSSHSHPTDASCANVASSHPHPTDTISTPSCHPHPTDMNCTSAPSSHHSMDINQTQKGLHFHPLPTSVSDPQVPSFLPLLDPRCSGAGGHWTLAEVQQELQMLQRQLGESFPLATPAVKTGLGSGNSSEASPCLPSSHFDATSFHYLSHLAPQQFPVHNNSNYFLQRTDPALPVSCKIPLPNANIFGDASSGSSGYHSDAKLTGGRSSARDLFGEHLNEIKSLRQRLEDSICTNDRLRQQLEDRLKATANGNGAPTNIYIQGLESLPQLSNENRALREENLSLQLQLSQLSRDHCKELEQLKEGLLSATSRLKNAEMELEQLRGESRKLQEEEKKQREEILHLRGERLSDQERSNRLQHKVTLLSQQLNEDQQLLQSLQSELQVYERLYGTSKLVLSAYSGETYHSLPSNFNFNELLSEIRHLRVQLEHSIQVNSSLRQHLEEQLEKNAGKYSTRPPPINIFTPSDHSDLKPPFQDAIPSPPVRDVGMDSPAPFCPSSSFLAPDSTVFRDSQGGETCWDDSGIQSSSMLEGDTPDGSFANKNGNYVIGHIDDYSALKQQILEGNVLISKMESIMQSSLNIPFLEIHGTQALDYGSIRQLFCISSTLHQILQESTSLLAVFWESRPSQHRGKQEAQSMKEEMLKLRSKLTEQENKLQTAVESLNTTNLLKENMEQFIVGQLTRTHDVLRRARTNLEKNNYKISSGKPHLFTGKGEIQERSPKYQSHVTPLFQEPLRKRSSLKSQKRREEEWSSPCFI
ncbi:myomegalin isoform X2 [Microcaecilia unicolor]|uniref:Myomegalin isoform X2 n=1 Tax=Microcaecilia unicolor TaxID=1415580 RepID=A0A6P7YK52_9AMPH|nr:myomegalin isoform X2 [Microcaecilia unicolor]